MARFQGRTGCRWKSRPRLEQLGDRTLLSVTTCTLSNGVLQATFCNDQDLVEIDANPAAQAIEVLINNQPSSFPTAEVQSLRISGLHLYDVVLLDTRLRLPMLLDGTVADNVISGWLAINASAVGHQHNAGSGILHWIIDTYNYQTGWSIPYPVSLTSDSPPASSGDSATNQFSRLASSLSAASFATASNSIAALGGHLFHYLGETPGAVSGTTADMNSSHDNASNSSAAAMQASLGGAAHEALTNPPVMEREPKPG